MTRLHTPLDCNQNALTDLPNPTSATDAATKGYVDTSLRDTNYIIDPIRAGSTPVDSSQWADILDLDFTTLATGSMTGSITDSLFNYDGGGSLSFSAPAAANQPNVSDATLSGETALRQAFFVTDDYLISSRTARLPNAFACLLVYRAFGTTNDGAILSSNNVGDVNTQGAISIGANVGGTYGLGTRDGSGNVIHAGRLVANNGPLSCAVVIGHKRYQAPIVFIDGQVREIAGSANTGPGIDWQTNAKSILIGAVRISSANRFLAGGLGLTRLRMFDLSTRPEQAQRLALGLYNWARFVSPYKNQLAHPQPA